MRPAIVNPTERIQALAKLAIKHTKMLAPTKHPQKYAFGEGDPRVDLTIWTMIQFVDIPEEAFLRARSRAGKSTFIYFDDPDTAYKAVRAPFGLKGYEVRTGEGKPRGELLGYTRTIEGAVALSIDFKVRRSGWVGMRELLEIFFLRDL